MKRCCLVLALGLVLVLSACETGKQAAYGQNGSPSLSADYTVERRDCSVYNADGSLALLWYYDLVQFTGDSAAEQAVNDSLERYCENFFAPYSGFLPPHKRQDDLWENTMTAQVSQNGDGLFSVILTLSWYMGGVANGNLYGHTYDLNTGAELSLSDLSRQEPDSLATTLLDVVKSYMINHPEVEWYPDTTTGLDSRNLEELPFLVDDGEIILCFPTYDLAPGAYGPTIIPTGIMAEHE